MFGSRGSDAAADGGATATAIQAGDVGKGARVAADELPNVATTIISAPTTSLKTLEPQQGKAAATAAAARTIEEQLWDAWNELPPPRAKSKELKETIAFFNAVKKTLFPRHNRKRKVLIDAGGGNGYLSWVLLAYGRVDRAIVADILFPDNTKQLLEKGLGKMRIAPNAMELIQCDIEEDFGTFKSAHRLPELPTCVCCCLERGVPCRKQFTFRRELTELHNFNQPHFDCCLQRSSFRRVNFDVRKGLKSLVPLLEHPASEWRANSRVRNRKLRCHADVLL